MRLNLDQRGRPGRSTLGESIAGHALTMEDDLMDMDFMASHAEGGFGLTGDEVDEYLRLAILGILQAGGLPHVWNGHSADTFDYGWDPTDRFGKTEDEIARNVIRVWRERGSRDPGMGWGDPVMFAMPGTRI